MTAGAIEALRYPRNPLDVLAQQIVAMVALDPWRSATWPRLVRRAAPFAALPDSALHAVLDMLCRAGTRRRSSPSCGRGSPGTG